MAKSKISPTIATAQRLEEAARLLRAVAPLFDGTPAAAPSASVATSAPAQSLPAVPRKLGRPATNTPASEGGKKKRSAELIEKIAAEIQRDPERQDQEIATYLNCTGSYVSKVRKRLASEASSPGG